MIDIDPRTDINCSLAHIIHVVGGILLIHIIPEYPPTDCNHSKECYDLAKYSAMLVEPDGTEMISFFCEGCYNKMLELQKAEIPIRAVQ